MNSKNRIKKKLENQRDKPYSFSHLQNSFHKLHNGFFFLQSLDLLLTKSLINSIISMFLKITLIFRYLKFI